MSPRTWAVVLLVASLLACGGKKTSPVGPSPTAPTVTGITITPTTDMIRIRGSESFVATASYSDGTTRAVQANWNSDSTGVATVEVGGRVTGIASGQALITSEYQGMRATRTLRVVPDYQGRWQGDWSVAGCTESGDWRGVCGTAYPTGSLFGITLALTQDRANVTGTTDFGDNLPGPVNGSISANGHLALGGTYTIVLQISGQGIPVEVTVSDWDTNSTDNERMTGRFKTTLRAPGFQGAVSTDGELRIVAKTSSTTTGVVPTAGMGLAHALTHVLPR